MTTAPAGFDLRGTHAVVFGGTGFIGRHLIDALHCAGASSIVAADIRPPRAPLPPTARFELCDVRHPINLAIDGAEPVVFNLAAVHRTPGHEDHEYFETNVAGAENTCVWATDNGATSMWFTSSIAVYGPNEQPRREDSELAPVSAYGRSKEQAEQIHDHWARAQPDRRLVTVRPATVFGPGEDGNFTRLAHALERRRFLYPSRRDTIKSCGYVGELVRSMLWMRQHADPVVTYNFTYSQPPTIEEVVEAFHDVAKLPRPLGVVPLKPLLLIARGLTAAGARTFDPERVLKLVRSTNIEPAVLLAHGYEYETTLRSGLQEWHDAEPKGRFV